MHAVIDPADSVATQAIRRDHERLVALFHRLTPDLAPLRRDALVRQLCNSLDVHAQIEEEFLYPALREAGVDHPALRRGLPDHDEMRRLVASIRATDPDDDALMPRVHELMRSMLHHLADEETVLLPLAERKLGEERMLELGERIAMRRAQLQDDLRDGRDELQANWPSQPPERELAEGSAHPPARTAAITVGALTAGMLLVRTLRRNGPRIRW